MSWMPACYPSYMLVICPVYVMSGPGPSLSSRACPVYRVMKVRLLYHECPIMSWRPRLLCHECAIMSRMLRRLLRLLCNEYPIYHVVSSELCNVQFTCNNARALGISLSGTGRVFPAFTHSITWLLVRPVNEINSFYALHWQLRTPRNEKKKFEKEETLDLLQRMSPSC